MTDKFSIADCVDNIRDALREIEDEFKDRNIHSGTIDDCIRALLKVRSAVKAAGLVDAKDDLDRVIRDLDPERRFA